MNNENENRQLLDDVLEEAAPAAFRAELLDRTLAHVRRRARNRRLARVAAGAAAVAIAAAFVLSRRAPLSPIPEPAATGGVRMVTSVPLDPSMLLASAPGMVRMIESAPDTVMEITTDAAHGPFRDLSDDELLAMMAGKSAILVRQTPHQAELLVVDATTHVARPVGQ